MAEHDLDAIALPTLNEAQMAALGRCPLTTIQAISGRGEAVRGRRSRVQVRRGQVRRGRDPGRLRRALEDHRGPRARPVHRRRGAPDRQPGARQRRRPGRLRGLRGIARRPAGADGSPPGPGRRHPAGVHRPLALPARVGAIHRPPRDRFARLARDLPGPHLPGQERRAAHLAGPGGRPAGATAAPAVPGVRGRHAPGRLGQQARAAAPLGPRARGGPRPPPAAGAGGLRPGGGRGRAGGVGRGGLRRVRRVEDGGAGAHGPRGAGRPQHADRELPGLPRRDHGKRAGGARLRAGEQVRGAHPRLHPGHAPDVRGRARGDPARRRRGRRDQVRADRHRGRLPPAGGGGVRGVRGPRRLLRRHPHRGPDVPGVGGRGRRGRQLRRTGRRLPRHPGAEGLPRDPRRRPQQGHVRLPGPAGRGAPPDRGAPQHGGPGDVRGRAPRRGRARQQQVRGGPEAEDAGGVQLHRGRAADRLAAAGDRAGRQGVRTDRAGPRPIAPLDGAAPAVPAGGQPPRRIRRGGRAVRLGQAGRFRGRRGGDGGAVRPRVSEGSETMPNAARPAPRGDSRADDG